MFISGEKPRRSFSKRLVWSVELASLIAVSQTPAFAAKGPSLTAIELYDTSSGPAYIQFDDFMINGKAELRNCGPKTDLIDKSEYGKLSKVSISVGGVLERSKDGILRYSAAGGQASCVVPDNLKFAHSSSASISAMADMAEVTGTPLGAGSARAPQDIAKGAKLVFISSPSIEFAEFLLAQRIGTISSWKNYLSGYLSSAHSSDAKQELTTLYIAEGATSLSAYEKTANTPAPSYSALKEAKGCADAALSLEPQQEPSLKLASSVQGSIKTLTAKGQLELDAYTKALADALPGYIHLENAQKIAEGITSVDLSYPDGKKLQSLVIQARNTYESALRSAAFSEDGQQWAQAMETLQPYRQFADEDARVAKIIDSAYGAFYKQAQQADQARDWQTSIVAYQSAIKAKNAPEVQVGLKSAQEQYAAARDKAAAQSALAKSNDYMSQHETIQAYEVLASLSKNQQRLVEEDMVKLEPAYVTAASQKASSLAKLYNNIGGIGDEREVERAYNFLKQANDLTEDEATKQQFNNRMQTLADELSGWFLVRAKHYLDKPVGSGTEIGWTYLKEAESYRAVNLEAVRDQMKSAQMAHDMLSQISIHVQFRDQTSQRQSEGFAQQMENSIAAGLDKSDISVKVFRSGETTRSDIEPAFLIAGDVLEHNISAPATEESIESKFLVDIKHNPNPEWNKVNREYEAAKEELQSDEAALSGAEAKGKSKQIQDVVKQTKQAQKKVDDLRTQLDSLPKEIDSDDVRPYRYRKTTYRVDNHIVLQFRIDDSLTGQKGEAEQIEKEEKPDFVVLNDVNAADVNNVRAQGTVPDKAEMLEELEKSARSEMIERVKQRVSSLPRKLYDDAQKREADGFAEDAGEAYLRYLNVAPVEEVTDRQHAEKFLRDKFNFLVFPQSITVPSRTMPPLVEGMTKSPN